jgi:hypothetical protein
MSAKTQLNELEAVELAVALKPVYAFLAALQQPGANIQTAMAGVNTLELTEAAQLPVLEAIGLNHGAAYVQSLLQEWQAEITTASSASGVSSASGNGSAPAPAPLVTSANGSSVL